MGQVQHENILRSINREVLKRSYMEQQWDSWDFSAIMLNYCLESIRRDLGLIS